MLIIRNMFCKFKIVSFYLKVISCLLLVRIVIVIVIVIVIIIVIVIVIVIVIAELRGPEGPPSGAP